MSDNNLLQQANEKNESGNLPSVVIPVIEEFLSVEKKTVESGKITVTKQVTETTENLDISLLSDEYVIQHVPINQYVEDAIPQSRQEGDVLILPVLKEVIVKRVLLVEEIRITKKNVERQEHHSITLRKESVDINRTSESL